MRPTRLAAVVGRYEMVAGKTYSMMSGSASAADQLDWTVWKNIANYEWSTASAAEPNCVQRHIRNRDIPI